MILTPTFSNAILNKRLKVWVLAPGIESDDDNISYYYDFSQSIEEYKKVFAELHIDWVWQSVSMDSAERVIGRIAAEKNSDQIIPLVLNLCDGDEINGAPGISVLRMLEEKDIIYTGADAYFYEITTSKVPMKRAFDQHAVANASWVAISNPTLNENQLFEQLGRPLIIKPAVSGGSMGVGVRNVVDNTEKLSQLLRDMFHGYRGWNLTTDGVIAEQFISGREFTILISGSYDDDTNAVVYTPVERVFHHSLPETEKFLSFDRLWEIYEEEAPMPGEENFYEYALPEESLIEPLKKLSWDAFCATKGKGYTRVDIRMDAQTGKLYVLEINAQCGISEDEDFTSIGAILRLSGKTFSQLVVEIMQDAWRRYEQKKSTCIQAGNTARA